MCKMFSSVYFLSHVCSKNIKLFKKLIFLYRHISACWSVLHSESFFGHINMAVYFIVV
jgi:hypothetical protein